MSKYRYIIIALFPKLLEVLGGLDRGRIRIRVSIFQTRIRWSGSKPIFSFFFALFSLKGALIAYTIRNRFSCSVSDPDPGGKNDPQKVEVLSAGRSLLITEGFSCSLDVLYGGQGIRKLKILSKKIVNLLFGWNFFPVFDHQKHGSGSGLVFSLKCRTGINESGSETLSGAGPA